MLNQDAPPPLPAPPALEVWLFERPFVLGGALVALTLIVSIALLQRGRTKPGGIAALVGFGLALGAVAAGSLVTTEREIIRARTHAFVDAVAKADAERAAELLGPRVEVRFDGARADRLDRAWLLDVIEAFEGPLKLKEHGVRDNDAAIPRPGIGRSQLRVHVVATEFPYPSQSWWRLDWAETPDGAWRIYAVDCLRLNGRTPSPSMEAAIERASRM